MTHPLRGLVPAELPPDLRARVLEAASLAERSDWWDRAYEDGRFWTAAAALAVLLLIALWTPFPVGGSASIAASLPPATGAEAPERASEEPSGAPVAEQWPLVSRELVMPWGSR